MKHHYRKLILGLVALLTMVWPAAGVFAAGASISLVANHSTISAGSTLIVAVYVNAGGTPINAVETDLNYPASKLEYVGLSYSGSAFSINTPSNGGGNGAVTIANGTISPISGSALVATVTFRGLVSSGSAAIGIGGSSNLISAGDNSAIPYSPSGVNVNFGVVPPSPTPTPAAAPPPKNTTPPVITGIKLSNLMPFSVTVSWTTNESSDSAVDYGLDTSYGLSNSSSSLTTSHSVALSSSFLTPETAFHYRVKSTDGSGNVATSPDKTLLLPGVPVTIVVLGPSGKPQPGASVTLDGATSTTDSSGSVTLPSGLGNKQITTSYQGVTVQKAITVAKSTRPLPPVQLDLSRQPLNHWMLTSIGLVVVVLTLLGIDATLFGSKLFAKVVGLRLMPKHLLPVVTKASSPETKPMAPIVGHNLDQDVPLDVNKSIGELMGEPAVPATPTPVTTSPVSEPIIHHIETNNHSSPYLPALESTPVPNSPPVTKIAVNSPLQKDSGAKVLQHRLKKKPPKAHPKTP